MEIKIISEEENPLLKREEVNFQVIHDQTGSTPPRLEVRKAVADTLKAESSLVFLKKLETKTGTHVATGTANIYDSKEQASLVEPKYIIERNTPPEKTSQEGEE